MKTPIQKTEFFNTLTALQKIDFRPLEISRYGDDRLEPAFSDRLRDANILYDRDEKGEFFSALRPERR